MDRSHRDSSGPASQRYGSPSTAGPSGTTSSREEPSQRPGRPRTPIAGQEEVPEGAAADQAQGLAPIVLRLQLSKRPDAGGRAGVAFTARANFLMMHLHNLRDFHQYDVVIANFDHRNPEWQAQEQREGGKLYVDRKKLWALFDGMSVLYLPKDLNLPVQGEIFLVQGVDSEGTHERRTFSLTLKKTATIFAEPIVAYQRYRLNPATNPPAATPSPDSLAALEFLIRQYSSQSNNIISVGRAYFLPETKEMINRNVLAMMKGVYGSARWTKGRTGVAVNVDTAHSVFYPEGPLLPSLRKLLRSNTIPPELNIQERNTFLAKFRNAMFSVTHRGAMRGRYRISALTSGDANTTFFEDPQGLRTSVADYFAQTYNLVLQYPRLPLIEVRGGRRTTHFPIEVCSILPHQRYLGRINEDETSALVKFATALPIEKKADIDRIHRVMGLDGNEYLDAFGARVDGEMMKVDARRLPAPNVLYQERGKAEGMHTKVNPGLQGFWNLPKDGIFLEGATLTGLLIVSLAHSRDLAMSGDNQDADDNLHDFAKELLKMGRQCGMRIAQDIRIPRPLFLQENDDIGKEIEAVVRRDRDWCRQNGQTPANLVLVILPTDAAKNPAYAEVKKVADVVLGIATQCLKPKWVKGMAPGDGGNRHGGDRGRGGRVGGRGGRGGYGGSQAPRRTGPSLFSQVILKINAKLGGRNTIVEGGLPIVDLEPTMVVGIDATHPPPNSTAFSIAAVVSSIDRYCTMYRTAIAVIPARTETLLDLDEMILDQMTLFQIHNNTFPSRIIVFRDGVSEGQFQNVVDGEVVRIKTAARFVSERTGLRYEPKITFIVVQKRHHTRLFCDQENSDRNGNAFPGTVIDSGIVNPDTFEFYMYSHPGLQGTSRPTKYQVLYDENGFSSDDLQALVYRLCFQYARSQRAVSLPPPVYYAHLVAARARCHLRGGDSDLGSVRSGGDERALDQIKDEMREEGGLWFI